MLVTKVSKNPCVVCSLSILASVEATRAHLFVYPCSQQIFLGASIMWQIFSYVSGTSGEQK